MIYSAQQIEHEMMMKRIIIAPYFRSQMNPNSVNLTLHNELLVYDEVHLDMKAKNRYKRYTIQEGGFMLCPGMLYLGRTNEYTESHDCVPGIEGRSSVARLGMSVHVTAGFGDVGFCGHWTLEMTVVHPLIIYPNVPICQIFYSSISAYDRKYEGKYQNNKEVQPSMMWKDFPGNDLSTGLASEALNRRD